MTSLKIFGHFQFVTIRHFMPKNAEKFGLAFWKECAAFDPSGDRISLCGQIFWMVANQNVYGHWLLYIIITDVVENKKKWWKCSLTRKKVPFKGHILDAHHRITFQFFYGIFSIPLQSYFFILYKKRIFKVKWCNTNHQTFTLASNHFVSPIFT